VCIGHDASEVIELIPAEIIVRVDRREKLACETSDGGIVRAPLADKVASRHYCWIARSLRRRGVEASAWNVAAAWNSGLRSVLSGRIPASTRDYADRVVNLIGSGADGRREEPVRIASR